MLPNPGVQPLSTPYQQPSALPFQPRKDDATTATSMGGFSALSPLTPSLPEASEELYEEVEALQSIFENVFLQMFQSRFLISVTHLVSPSKTLKVLILLPKVYPGSKPPDVVATINGFELTNLDFSDVFIEDFPVCYPITSSLVDTVTEVPCSVCFEECVNGNLPCLHPLCDDCLAEYLRTKISEGDFTEIPCPVPECPSIVPEAEFRRLLETNLYSRYLERLTRKAVREMDDMTFCPKCSNPADVTGKMGHCHECRFEFCVACGESFHPGKKCLLESDLKAAVEELKKAKHSQKVTRVENTVKENLQSLLRISAICRACPHCSTPIEKNMGCNHMWCISCRRGFNWEDAMSLFCDVTESKEKYESSKLSTVTLVEVKTNKLDMNQISDVKLSLWDLNGALMISLYDLQTKGKLTAHPTASKYFKDFTVQCPNCGGLYVRVSSRVTQYCISCLRRFCSICGEQGNKRQLELHFHKSRIEARCPEIVEVNLPEDMIELAPAVYTRVLEMNMLYNKLVALLDQKPN